MRVLDRGRLVMGASAVGAAQKLLDLSLDYARQMLHHAAWLRDQQGAAVTKETSMVKLFCTEMACRVAG
jgi:acyl-CoA dehydrogenase